MKKKTIYFLIKYIITVIISFILLLLTFSKEQIMSSSMEPTLMTGDVVLFEKITYHLNGIKQGDIIEFNYNGEKLCKRVIGVAGDTICIKDGYLYRNKEKINEPYLMSQDSTYYGTNPLYTIPKGCVFVMGDNRELSYDSRYWDNPYIPLSNITGKYICNINW